MVNPFWKDILNDWISFCNGIDIEKTQGILDSPLWYNKKIINGNNFCIYEWHRKGIRHVSDLLDEQGNIYDFEIFKTRFGLRGTFLDFQALIRKIPNRWKTTLNVIKIFVLLINLMLNAMCM